MLRCTKEPLNLDHSAASCERVNTPHLVNTPPLVQEHEGGEPCDAVLLRQLPVGDRRLAVDCQDVQHTPVPLHGTGATFKQPPVREDAAEQGACAHACAVVISVPKGVAQGAPSGCTCARRSRMGFIIRQGPHQLALKSSSTAFCRAPCVLAAHSQPREGRVQTANKQML